MPSSPRLPLAVIVFISYFVHTASALAAPRPIQATAASARSTGLPPDGNLDVIFSSGFLCFSRHVGFASALQDHGLLHRVDRFVGTSSGSLAAAMLASGLTPAEVSEELSSKRPLAECRLARTPWRGAFSTRALQRRLRTILPPTFEDLPRPLAVGVYDAETKKAKLVSSGPLIPAVAASCAVPGGMFSPVRLDDGRLYADGGKIDRTFVRAWREWKTTEDRTRGSRLALLHLVSSDPDADFAERDGIPDDFRKDVATIMRSPRTAGKLWSLRTFDDEVRETRMSTSAMLQGLGSYERKNSL